MWESPPYRHKVWSQKDPSAHPVPPQEGDTVVEASGSKQAHIAAAFTSMPATATRLVAECLGRGDRVYGKNNHEGITVEDHINHAIAHMYAWIEDKASGMQYPHSRELHLVHAVSRALLALDCAVNDGHPTQYRHPSGD